MARILIVGGGCRGRRLVARLMREGGHAARITTREESGRAAIEATGAECLVGTPDRLASMRGALDGVTIACWLLGTASGTPEQVQALHGPRLRAFLSQAIDTTVRGFVYETAGVADAEGVRAEGERIVREVAGRNAIPTAILGADIEDPETWQAEALVMVEGLLGGRGVHRDTLSSG